MQVCIGVYRGVFRYVEVCRGVHRGVCGVMWRGVTPIN